MRRRVRANKKYDDQENGVEKGAHNLRDSQANEMMNAKVGEASENYCVA